jgi:hypothetical protein
MEKSTKKTLKYVGIGAVGLYLLSKVQGSNPLADALNDFIGGIGESVGDTIAGGVSGAVGAVGDTFMGLSEGITVPIAGLFMGQSKAQEKWNTGREVIASEGLGVVFWSRDRINQYVMPNAEKITPGTGYKTESGYTYISESAQTKAARLQSIMLANPGHSGGDVAYQYNIEHGISVAGWNLAGLTPHFKAEMGIT